jgi:catechol 2,3-dioxygenase-like lactoylglutathione lyase family enzyme
MASRKKSAKKSARKNSASKKSAKNVATKKNGAARPKARKAAKPASKKSAAKKTAARKSPSSLRTDVPSLFRINVEVGNLDEAARFYGELLGMPGRRQAGSRVYFDCGPVTLQVVDVSAMGMGVPHPAAKALYFLVRDLDAVFARAEALGCLSREMVHGARGGAITVRPWGERSFYAEDKWKNPLCFVEAGTTYPG